MRSACLLALMIGCGGDPERPATPGSTKLNALSPAESRDLCQYANDLVGDKGSVLCDDNTRIFWQFDSCASGLPNASLPYCPATVLDIETCFEQLAANKCDPTCHQYLDYCF